MEIWRVKLISNQVVVEVEVGVEIDKIASFSNFAQLLYCSYYVGNLDFQCFLLLWKCYLRYFQTCWDESFSGNMWLCSYVRLNLLSKRNLRAYNDKG